MIEGKPLFTAFFNAMPERLHFAAHSHHPWPDITLKAQRQYWQDSVRMADDKWDLVFNGIIPDVQGYIASLLNLPDGETLAFDMWREGDEIRYTARSVERNIQTLNCGVAKVK